MYKLIGIETEEEEGDTGIFEFRPVGFGLQVWEPILKTCVEIGSRWVIVEQDEHYELDPKSRIFEDPWLVIKKESSTFDIIMKKYFIK